MYGYEEFEEFREFEQVIENMDEETVFMALGVMAMIFLVIGIALLVGYIFRSLGLYTMAKNRGIKNPWLAWIPVGNYWIAGSIADQYRYVAKGEIKNRRKILLALGIVPMVVSSVSSAMGEFVAFMDEETLLMLTGFMFLFGLVNAVASIAIYVFWQIAMYDLYTSCDPDKNVLLLVLGIIFGFLEPFFIFFNRKKERGMPPRRPVEEEPVYQPEPEPRTYQDPWENN